MGKEEDLAAGAMASSTVPCHTTQYSWPKKLKKSQPPALPLYPLSRISLEQRPGLRLLTELCSEDEAQPDLHSSVIRNQVAQGIKDWVIQLGE